MKKSIKTLSKELDFKSETDYFFYMIDSYLNGNFSQCKELFNAMQKTDMKKFIMYISDTEDLKKVRNFYFALL